MIFVSRGYDAHKDQVFYRPIGGRIEFGERGRDAVAREVMEELGAAITDIRYLGALENIFSYAGGRGHEIVLIYDGRFIDAALSRDDFRGRGMDGADILYEARWHKIDYFRGAAAPPLYPRGLLELLDAAAGEKG